MISTVSSTDAAILAEFIDRIMQFIVSIRGTDLKLNGRMADECYGTKTNKFINRIHHNFQCY